MTEGKFNKLTNLSHLLATATDIVVTNIVKVGFLVLTLDGVTLSVNDSILSNNAEFGGIGFNDLELDCSHTTTDKESVALPDRSVSLD